MDLTSFGAILEKIGTESYNKLLHRYTYKLHGDQNTAEDILSDAMTLLLEKKEQFAGSSEKQIQIWLMRAADYKVQEYWRKGHVVHETGFDESVSALLENREGENPFAAIDEGWNENQSEEDRFLIYLDEIARQLRGADLQLFIGRVVNRKGYKQLAEDMHSTEGALKARWSRLRPQLIKLVGSLIGQDRVQRFVNQSEAFPNVNKS